MHKKIVTIFLFCTLFFVWSAMLSTVFADNSQTIDEELLSLLNIADKGNDEKYVTRGELAQYGVKLINAAIGEDSEKIFDDVEGAQTPYINAAYRYGLMTGRNENIFAPGENCTQLEMDIVLLRAAKYVAYADTQGGYPDGYIRAAQRLGLLQGSTDDFVTKSQARKLLLKTLGLEMPEMSLSGEHAVFKTGGGKTVLEYYFNIRKVTGRIVSVGETAVGGYTPAGINRISVLTKEGVENYEGGDDLTQLGYKSNFYIVDQTDDETVFYLKLINDSVNAVNLISGDIESVSRNMEQLSYRIDKDRKRTAKLSEQTVYIYNGAAVYGITPEDLNVQNGSVTLIDFNLDNVYDLIHIWSYHAYMVESTNTKNASFTDKTTKAIIDINIYSADYEVELYKNDRPCEFLAVNEGDVILIADSKKETGKIKRKAVVVSDVIEGRVTRIGKDAMEIDGKDYRFAPEINKMKVEVNQTYIFGFNLNGQLCICYKVSNPEQFYAYMFKLYQDEAQEDKIFAGLLTEENQIETVLFSKNFYSNGKKSDYEALYNSMANEGYFVPQLVLVKLGEDGTVKRIYTGGAVQEPTPEPQEGLFLNFSSDSTLYKTGPGSFDAQWLIGPESKIFEIYMKSGNKVDIEKSRVITKSAFNPSDASRPNAKLYNSGANHIAQAAVITYSQDLSSFKDDIYTRQMIVVNSVEEEVSEDGDIVKILNGVHLGNECSYEIHGEMKNVQLLQQGDCIYGSFNSENILYGYEMRFSMHKKTEHEKLDYISSILFGDMNYTDASLVGNANSTRGGITGIVTDKTKIGDVYAVTLRCFGTNMQYVYLTDANTYVYDAVEKRDGPEAIGIENMDIGNRIFLASRYGYARDILIYG